MGSRASRHGPPGAAGWVGFGWGRALLGALVALAGAGGVAEGLAFLVAAGGKGVSYQPGLTARVGGLLFLWFHHARLVLTSSVANPSSGLTFRLSLSVAILGGTAIAGALLGLGGRAVASAALARGSTAMGAALHGLKVGPPYAVACLGVAIVSRATAPVPASVASPGAAIVIHAIPLQALLWPLGIGLAAGLGGGLWAVRQAPARAAWERRLRAAVAGGWRMVVAGLTLSFAGLLVLAAVHPEATRSYFRGAFGQGRLTGVALVATTASLVPNMAAWVLFPSMGSCLAVVSGARTACLLSYQHFAGSGSPADPLRGLAGHALGQAGGGPAPAPYLLFLAIPAAAAVLGGVRAAGRAAPASRAEAAGMGASAGLVFGVLSAGLVLLATTSGQLSGQPGSSGSGFQIGPWLLASSGLALAWGVVGGALGGLARGPERSNVAHAPEPEDALRGDASGPGASPPP